MEKLLNATISDSDIVSKAYISDLTKIVIGILSFIITTVFGFLTSIRSYCIFIDFMSYVFINI